MTSLAEHGVKVHTLTYTNYFSHLILAPQVGPRWNGRPPSLTVVVKEPQTEPRFSVMKQVTLYDVETKELGSCVTRKYKQFLWLYDRLAENFPCVSLPHLPVKQGSGKIEFYYNGLENGNKSFIQVICAEDSECK